MVGMPTFVNFLRIWLGFVALLAIGNTVQCFISHTYLKDRLYTVNEKNVSRLTARLFGVWTLLAGGLRFMCALNITNKGLYHSTLFSFLLALGHFSSEVYIYKTATLTVGILAPLIVSSISVILMLLGYRWVRGEDPRAQVEDENELLVKGGGIKKKR